MCKQYTRIVADYLNQHYEPYFDRWDEGVFHDPKLHETYEFMPEEVPTKMFDTGEVAAEEAEAAYYDSFNTQRERKKRWLIKRLRERLFV